MKNAIAFANNDVATIAWSYGVRPAGCMGFALYRIDATGAETVLPSHAVFKGDTIAPGQTTAQFPIQKFYWKDPYARLAGDRTHSYAFRWKIVPLEGSPGSLVPMKSQPILTTNEVTLTSQCSPSLSATFNRGLISTQHVSAALGGTPSKTSLLADISQPGNALRTQLAGDTLPTMLAFLARTMAGGTMYAALYELTDAQLVAALKSIGAKLNLIVADIVPEKPKRGSTPTPENDPAWKTLKQSAASALYRKPTSSHIVHNKFLIYVDATGPAAVLTGSTNWTDTGLCAQTNNVLVIDDRNVARRYLAYWKALQADEKAHESGGPFQGPTLRSFDATGKQLPLDARTAPSTLTSYFSPNTKKQRAKTHAGEAAPIDMKDLNARITAASEAVLFLAFIPGTPSIVDFAAAAQRANKNLFVRGCVTAVDAAGEFYYALRGSSPPKHQTGQTTPQDQRVIAATALDKADAPPGWTQEILNAGFAITHDKIVVIDPFSDDCVVVTGSHNLGYQASYNNDENLVMIRGNRRLAQAYATHVLDVYDHFAWRWMVAKGTTTDAYLKSTPDAWLGWYYDANGDIKSEQLTFWLHASAT